MDEIGYIYIYIEREREKDEEDAGYIYIYRERERERECLNADYSKDFPTTMTKEARLSLKIL